MPTILAFLYQPNRAYLSLSIQPEVVIIEVSMVQALKLRTNPRRAYEVKYLPIGPMVKASYLNM